MNKLNEFSSTVFLIGDGNFPKVNVAELAEQGPEHRLVDDY